MMAGLLSFDIALGDPRGGAGVLAIGLVTEVVAPKLRDSARAPAGTGGASRLASATTRL
jgi:hypothetical protein